MWEHERPGFNGLLGPVHARLFYAQLLLVLIIPLGILDGVRSALQYLHTIENSDGVTSAHPSPPNPAPTSPNITGE